MLLYYRFDDQVRQLEVEPDTTVGQLRTKIEGIPSAEESLLYCRGKPLQDNEIIKNFAQAHDTIDVNVKLPGAKVHGSLAGAGKVKGKTTIFEELKKMFVIIHLYKHIN